MLYLDYAKPLADGKYILSFFADSVADLESISHGQKFVTKNGTDYGVPQAGSTVIVTSPEFRQTTYVMDAEGVWVVTEDISYSAVVANPSDAATAKLEKLKVNDTTYANWTESEIKALAGKGEDGVGVTSFETVSSTVVGDNTNTTVRAHFSNNTTDEFVVSAKNGKDGSAATKIYKHYVRIYENTVGAVLFYLVSTKPVISLDNTSIKQLFKTSIFSKVFVEDDEFILSDYNVRTDTVEVKYFNSYPLNWRTALTVTFTFANVGLIDKAEEL